MFLRHYLQFALSGLRVEWILKEMRVIYYSDGSKSDSELYRKVEWYSYSSVCNFSRNFKASLISCFLCALMSASLKLSI